MIEAALWGGLAASALLAGALLAFFANLPKRVVGLILAFGAGTLFGAVAYELVEEAARASMSGIDVALGFAAGSVVFFLGSVAIDRLSPDERALDRLSSKRDPRRSGLALVLGAVLDGIPESIVLGLSLAAGGTVGPSVFFAVLVSNVPEGLSGSADLVESGLDRRRVAWVWIRVALASALFSAIGYGILGPMGTTVVVTLQAFAAGAILAMLAESMIPEAHETGGRAVGLALSFGFAVAAYLSLRVGG